MFKILNPVNGGNPFCSPKRAERYLRQGRAIRVNETTIRFVAEDSRHKAAQVSAEEYVMRSGYDRINRFFDEKYLKHLPVVNGHNLIAPIGKRKINTRFRPTKAEGEGRRVQL